MDQQPPPAPVPADAPQPAPPAPTPAPPQNWSATPPAGAPPYWQSAPDAIGPAPGVEFAGFGARLIAYIVDGFIASIIIFGLSFFLIPLAIGTSNGDQISGLGAATLTVWVGIVILVSLLYFPFFWQRSGQTPGMRMLGIRVVRDRDGGKIGWLSAILRYIGYAINGIIPGLPIGWLWVLVDKRRRGWHDLIGGTVVIKA